MKDMKKEESESDFFIKLIQDSEFKENLYKLGKFEYFDDDLEEPIIFEYWTDTRWKISKIENLNYILTPAFWNDGQIEARFALICDPKFNLKVYMKKNNEEKIIGRIGCYTIITDYTPDLEKISSEQIILSPKDEILATIQNLDAFFTEKTPTFMSFDFNIIVQALQMIIDKKYATEELLNYRCDEIKEIIFKLAKENFEDKINPQIYIQIIALLDFDPEKWVYDINKKISIYKYAKKMYEIRENMLYYLSYALGKLGDTDKIISLIQDLDDKIYLKFYHNVIILKSNLAECFETIGEAAIDPLIKALKHKNSLVRDVAVFALRKMGSKKAATPLLEALKHDNLYSRVEVISALGKIGDLRAVIPIIQTLKDKNPEVRQIAAANLGELHDKRAVDPLIEALKDKRPEVRQAIIFALEKIGDNKSVEPLIEMLNDKNKYVRQYAARALGRFPDKRSIIPLIHKLEDEDLNVRSAVAFSLGMLKDKRAVKPIIQALEISEHPNLFIHALGELRDKRAVEPIIKFLKHKDFRIREDAALALGNIKDRRAINPLLEALRDKNRYVRRMVVDTLKKFKKIKRSEPIIKILTDEDPYVRRYAAKALMYIREKSILKPLIDSLKDEDKFVRKYSAKALGRLGDEKAIIHLINMLNDDNKEVRINVSHALVKLVTRIKDKDILISLIKGLETALNDENLHVRKYAVIGFGKIGNYSKDFLIQALEDAAPEVRSLAVVFLGKMGKIAVEPLITALNDESYLVRSYAVIYLGKIGDLRAVGPLISIINDKSPEVRSGAMKVLIEMAYLLAIKLARYCLHFN